MDSLKGAVFYFPTTALLYARWALATSISALPVLYHSLVRRTNLLNDLGGMYSVMRTVPLGRYCFSGLVAAFAPNNASYVRPSVCPLLAHARAYLALPCPETNRHLPPHSFTATLPSSLSWPTGAANASSTIFHGTATPLAVRTRWPSCPSASWPAASR